MKNDGTVDLWKRAFKAWQARGVRGVWVKATCLIEDFWFDWRFKTDTHRKLRSIDPSVTSVNAADAVRYAPTRARYFSALMRALNLPHDRVFVDVGSGKGKVLMMAMEYGLKKVVGIEFSPSLWQIARNNLKSYCEARSSQWQWEIHALDVADYEIKDDESIFFLYHPFYDNTMLLFIDRVKDSLHRSPRSIWLIYHKPSSGCRDIIENCGNLLLSEEFEYNGEVFLVYRNAMMI